MFVFVFLFYFLQYDVPRRWVKSKRYNFERTSIKIKKKLKEQKDNSTRVRKSCEIGEHFREVLRFCSFVFEIKFQRLVRYAFVRFHYANSTLANPQSVFALLKEISILTTLTFTLLRWRYVNLMLLHVYYRRDFFANKTRQI